MERVLTRSFTLQLPTAFTEKTLKISQRNIILLNRSCTHDLSRPGSWPVRFEECVEEKKVMGIFLNSQSNTKLERKRGRWEVASK